MTQYKIELNRPGAIIPSTRDQNVRPVMSQNPIKIPDLYSLTFMYIISKISGRFTCTKKVVHHLFALEKLVIYQSYDTPNLLRQESLEKRGRWWATGLPVRVCPRAVFHLNTVLDIRKYCIPRERMH